MKTYEVETLCKHLDGEEFVTHEVIENGNEITVIGELIVYWKGRIFKKEIVKILEGDEE